jgi:hypothetical protein
LEKEVCGGEKKVQRILAEFTEAWLSAAGPAGGLPRVILIIPLQSLIVRCGGAGRIETMAAAIYEAQRADTSPAQQSRDIHQ